MAAKMKVQRMSYSLPVINVGQLNSAKYTHYDQSGTSLNDVILFWTNSNCPRSTLALNNSGGGVSNFSFSQEIEEARTTFTVKFTSVTRSAVNVAVDDIFA